MTVVVTPLSEPTTDKGAPLTPGVLVEQKGNEGQHLQLASPAIVTFALQGQVPEQSAVVTFTDPETAQPLASSISKQGETTMVTAFVSSFSETTVDGDPDDWGDLASLVPDYRWSLAVSGTDATHRPGDEDDPERRWPLTCTDPQREARLLLHERPPDHGHRGIVRRRADRRQARAAPRSSGEAKLDECWVQSGEQARRAPSWCAALATSSSAGRPRSSRRRRTAARRCRRTSKRADDERREDRRHGEWRAEPGRRQRACRPSGSTTDDYAWKYPSTLTWVKEAN